MKKKREFLKLDRRNKTDSIIAEILKDLYDSKAQDFLDMKKLGSGTLTLDEFNLFTSRSYSLRKEMFEELIKYISYKIDEDEIKLRKT